MSDTRPRPRNEIPSALARLDEIARRLDGATPAVFLDYDGTLTPIVEHPDLAVLSEEGRDTVRRLASVTPVAVISGRDTEDVRDKVGLPGLVYAGSHGFDIRGIDDGDRFEEYLEPLARASDRLESGLEDVSGAHVERKRYATAVHFRQVRSAADERRVREVFEAVASAHPELRATGGKKVLELRPDVPWDKGRALEHVLERMGLDRDDVVPVYVGDDVTDEDAFRVLSDRGIGVVVGRDGEPSLADYALENTSEALALLRMLTDLR